MSLTPPKGISLRPALPADTPRLAEIAREAIEELAADDYDADQRAAWAAVFDDEDKLAARLAPAVTLVAEAEDEVVAFLALQRNEEIDLLYVAPDHAGRGIATFLCQAIERLAQGRKAARLTVKASDTALPLFDTLGYEPRERSSVSLGGEWLAHTTMQKLLDPSPAGAAS